MEEQLNKFAPLLAVSAVTGTGISFSSDESLELLMLLSHLKANPGTGQDFEKIKDNLEDALTHLESVLYQCCEVVSVGSAGMLYASRGIRAYADALRILVVNGRMSFTAVNGDYVTALKPD